MDKLKEHVVTKLRECREDILNISKDKLTGAVISNWFQKWHSTFNRADTISGQLLPINIKMRMDGFWDEVDPDVCLELRVRVVELIDDSIMSVDSKQIIKPILEDLISKVADTKLSTLLKEFNVSRIDQPNIAASGFRTILPLIIRERAKKVDPGHNLATKDDIGFECDINVAVVHPSLFRDAEKKLLRRYLIGGDKDSFDNVVHKPDYLINKEELDDAVDLLNRLLPTIID